MGVCGTPWRIVEVGDVWEGIAHRIPEAAATEILSACQAGEALCLECGDGVLIITLTPDSESLEFRLFVLLAVGYMPGAYQRRDPDLDKLAADLGASSISGLPARRGWGRLLGPNWIRQGDVFTREVNHGRQAKRPEANSPAESAG